MRRTLCGFLTVLAGLLFVCRQRQAGAEVIEGKYYSRVYSCLSANVGNAHPADLPEGEKLWKLQPGSEEERLVKEEITRLDPDILILIEAYDQDQARNICFDREKRRYTHSVVGGLYDFICIRNEVGEIVDHQAVLDDVGFGAAYTDIKLKDEEGRMARIFFVHPPSNFPKPPFLWTKKEHQIHQDIFQWVCGHMVPDVPCLIAGDFNNDFVRWQEKSSLEIKSQAERLGLWIFNPLSIHSMPDGSAKRDYEATHRLPNEAMGERTLDWVLGKNTVPPSQVPERGLKTSSFTTTMPGWWQQSSPTAFDHKPLFGQVVFSWPEDNTQPETASALAVVMDSSGSMEGEKLSGAKRAASGLLSILTPSDRACLIAFSEAACREVELAQVTEESRAQLQKRIGILEAGDRTNITAGLELALDELWGCGSKTAAFLLSDGMHNVGPGPLEGYPSIAQRFRDAGCPVSTIAYGSGGGTYSGVDEKTLRDIALLTGGTFWWGSPANLTQVYHKINAHLNNQSVLVSYNDLISQGKQLTYQASIDEDIERATFFADWQGSLIELCLTTPDKTEIRPDNFSETHGVSYQKGATFCFYQIDNPTPGKWNARLIGQEINQPKEQVNLTVSGASSFSANILGFQPCYSQREAIPILVKVSGAQNAKVSAVIKKPSPNLKGMLERNVIDIGALLLHALFKKQKVKLYDDGQHNDLDANDGFFGGLYQDADINGCYLVTVRCVSTKPNKEKTIRVLKESIQIGPIEDRSVTLADFLGL